MTTRLISAIALACTLATTACGNNPNIRGVQASEYNDPSQPPSQRGRMGGDQGLVFGVGKGTAGKNNGSGDSAASG